MFNRKRVKVAAAEQPAPALAPLPSSQDEHAQQEELLRRWMSLAGMQQRVIKTLVAEIKQTSNFVETEADSLSGRFQRLAVCAEQQTARWLAEFQKAEVDKWVPLVKAAKVKTD